MVAQNKRLFLLLLSIPLILLIPFVAMQFTTEVIWSVGDFLAMGVLWFGVAVACEFILRKVKKTNYRLIAIVAVLIGFFLVFAELAVGLFGTPFAGS